MVVLSESRGFFRGAGQGFEEKAPFLLGLGESTRVPCQGEPSVRRHRVLVLGMVTKAVGQGRGFTEEAGGRVLEWS